MSCYQLWYQDPFDRRFGKYQKYHKLFRERSAYKMLQKADFPAICTLNKVKILYLRDVS